MTGKNLGRVVSVLFVLMLACGTLAAQQTYHVRPQPNQVVTPALPEPPAPAVIYTNFGTPTNLYYAADGWVVSGPNNTTFVGSENWIAVPFIPKANSHVQQIQAAIGSISGTNNIQLGLMLDTGTNGVGVISSPNGTYITGAVKTITSIPPFGTCCTATVLAHFTGAGTAVTAGTVYWVVAQSTTTGIDFAGAWAFSVDALGNGNTNLGGWASVAVLGGPAMLVKGTTP